VLVFTGDDDDESNGSGAETAGLYPNLASAEGVGITARYPDGWKKKESRDMVSLQSEDGCIAMTLAAPAEASAAGQVKRDSIAALSRSLGKAKFAEAPPQTFGGLPTTGVIAEVQDPRGRAALVRLSVSRGKELAYVTQVILRSVDCPDAEQAAGIVQQVEFRK
jgi:hypothetical protein